MHLPIESLNLLMLNVGYAEHDSDWNWKEVSSPFIRIFYIKKGEASLELPSGNIKLKEGHLYIIPPFTKHTYKCHGHIALYYLHVYEGFKKATDIFEHFDFPIEVKSDAEDEKLFENLRKKHPEAKLPASDPNAYDNSNTLNYYAKRYATLPLHEKMWIRGCTLILLSNFIKHATPKKWTSNNNLIKALKYIQENIHKNISINDVANTACITNSYMARLFKQNFGVSPLHYINQKKIDKAQLLLLTDNCNIKELAYILGYNDHSYFIRLFKKHTGMTPQEYRTVHKNSIKQDYPT